MESSPARDRTCLLHWQVESLPLSHQESSTLKFLTSSILSPQSILFPFTLGPLSCRQKYTWIFYTWGIQSCMTQRWKIIENHKSSLCQPDTHKDTKMSTCSYSNSKTGLWVWRDFLGGPVVKNPPANARYAGLIPSHGTKIPTCHGAMKPVCHHYWNPCSLQPVRLSLCAAREILHEARKIARAATKNQHSQINFILEKVRRKNRIKLLIF